MQRNFWASSHRPMWSHGNISWKAKYFLTFIDDSSRKTFFYTMKTKFGVFDKLKVFNSLVEYQTRKNMKVIRCDGGGEYNFKNFNTFCKEMAL